MPDNDYGVFYKGLTTNIITYPDYTRCYFKCEQVYTKQKNTPGQIILTVIKFIESDQISEMSLHQIQIIYTAKSICWMNENMLLCKLTQALKECSK